MAKRSKNTDGRFFFDLIHEDAVPPEKAHDGDAAWDVFNVGPITIEANSMLLVSTGLVVEFPPEYAMLMQGKSGLSHLGLFTIGNVIDSGYRGEVHVMIVNLSGRDIHFTAHEKIAQFLFIRISQEEMKQKKLADMTASSRGTNCNGSSGSKPREEQAEERAEEEDTDVELTS